MGKDAEDIVAKVRAILDGEAQPSPLTAAEVKRLRAMIAAFDWFLASGKVGRSLMLFVITAASFITAMIVFLNWLKTAIAGWLG